MALPKLYDRTTWHNNTTPALNEDNLNAMSQALDDIDDRVIDLAGTIMEDVPQIIEDMATIEEGLETVGQAVTDAQTAATAATADKLKSEGFAVGEQNGVPVDSSSPYYHNNAKYYSQVAPPTAAAHVSYDHSQSHLAATNVQGAVDELKEALTDEAETRAKNGAHNLLPSILSKLKTYNTDGTWSNNVYTMPCATFTVNSDGTITVTSDGTAAASSKSDFNLLNTADCTALFGSGTYKISGCPAGGANNKYLFYVNGSNSTEDVGNGGQFTNASGKAFIRIYGGQVLNMTFKPMIRLATDADPTYQPYAMTNKELTDNLAVQSSGNGTDVFTAETGWSLSDAFVQRKGRVVHIGGYAVSSSNITTGTELTIGTLKDSTLFPKKVERGLTGCGTDPWFLYQPCYISINTSGVIKVYVPSGTSVDNVGFNFTFII